MIFSEAQMKLAILFVVVVGAILVWWLRGVKPKRRIDLFQFPLERAASTQCLAALLAVDPLTSNRSPR
jgi:Flp pilus assembly protein TadB